MIAEADHRKLALGVAAQRPFPCGLAGRRARRRAVAGARRQVSSLVWGERARASRPLGGERSSPRHATLILTAAAAVTAATSLAVDALRLVRDPRLARGVLDFAADQFLDLIDGARILVA